MFKAILVSLASLTALVGVTVASASDDDFTMGTILTEPIHYSVTPFNDTDILSYDANTDVCQYWSVSPLGDWYYGIVINPIVTYDILAANPAKVVECSTKE